MLIFIIISSTVDPIIKVNSFGITRNSEPKKNKGTGMTYWGEHMFFNKKFDVFFSFLLNQLLKWFLY